MPQRVLALEITDADVRAAVLETTFRDYRVAGFYQEPLSPANGTKEEQIRRFVERHSLNADSVLSALPGDCVTWRTFFLPFRDRKRLLQTIPFELESQVPFGLDEVVVDHHIVHRDRSGTTVLAALVLKRDLERHLEMLQTAGIDPKVVDIGPLASLNTLNLVPNLPPTYVFLACNGRSCTVALYRNKDLVGLRTLTPTLPGGHQGNGSGAPVEDIVDDDDAGQERSPRRRATNGAEHDLHEALVNGQLAPLAEIRWTLLALNGAPLDDELPCYVAGDTAALNFRVEELEQLGLKVQHLDHLRWRTLDTDVSRKASGFTSSLGLALREVSPAQTIGVNFRQGEFTYHRSELELRRGLRVVAALAALVVALTVADLYMEYRELAGRAALIDTQIRKVVSATLPDVAISAPKAQLQQEIDAVQQRLDLLHGVVPMSGSTSVDIMRAISAAIPSKVRIDSEEYTLDPDAVRIRGNTDTFESVDTIKQQLLATGYFSEVEVKDVKASKDGASVDFRLRLVLSKDFRPHEGKP